MSLLHTWQISAQPTLTHVVRKTIIHLACRRFIVPRPQTIKLRLRQSEIAAGRCAECHQTDRVAGRVNPAICPFHYCRSACSDLTNSSPGLPECSKPVTVGLWTFTPHRLSSPAMTDRGDACQGNLQRWSSPMPTPTRARQGGCYGSEMCVMSLELCVRQGGGVGPGIALEWMEIRGNSRFGWWG